MMGASMTPDITQHIVELIKQASTDLPPDVEEALRKASSEEAYGSPARDALETILANVELARRNVTPLCQDTGTPLFYIDYPAGWSAAALCAQVEDAVAKATATSLLRPNAVDSLTGKNSGNNIGAGLPSIYTNEWQEQFLRIRLLLKGGGCENVGVQYSLPDASLGAARDLEGVRRAVLHSVHQAQGRGCSPGILGVCIGGDRGQGYSESKKQLLRPLNERNPVQELEELEKRLLKEGNTLGIGPMGFGGKITLLGVKIGSMHRLPASYFVTVSYMCWACRRRQLTYHGEGAVEFA